MIKLKPKNSICLLLLLCVLFCIVPVKADFAPVFFPHDTSWMDANDSRYPEALVKARKAQTIYYILNNQVDSLVDYLAIIVDSLKNDLATSNIYGADPQSFAGHARKAFLNQLDSLRKELNTIVSDRANYKNTGDIFKTVMTGRFQMGESDGLIAFFPARVDEIVLDPSQLNVEQAQDIRYRAQSIQVFFGKVVTVSARAKTLEGINLAYTRWTNYIDKGYSQYPWEGWLNSQIDFSIESPPSHQWIFVHPEPSMEVSTKSLKTLNSQEVLTIEMLGLIKYGGNYYDNYKGAAVIVAIRDDMGVGIGGVFHFGAGISAGVAYHDYPDREVQAIFSFDLYKKVEAKHAEYLSTLRDLEEKRNSLVELLNR